MWGASPTFHSRSRESRSIVNLEVQSGGVKAWRACLVLGDGIAIERSRANADTAGLTRYRAGHLPRAVFFWNCISTLGSREASRGSSKKSLSFTRAVAGRCGSVHPDTALARVCPR